MDPYYAAGFIALAAALATLVRLEDWPPTEWSKDEIGDIIATFIGALIVAVFLAWYMAETAGVYINTIEGFLIIVVMATGGVATIRALLGQATKVEE